MILYAVDSNNNNKDAVYSYAVPANSRPTGALSSIIIDLDHIENGEIGFASISRMGLTRQKISFVIHNAYWLQDTTKKVQKDGSNSFSFALNLVDSSNGQVV